MPEEIFEIFEELFERRKKKRKRDRTDEVGDEERPVKPPMSPVFCLRCGARNEGADRFCQACGELLPTPGEELRCPKCGNPVPLTATFCPRCGTRVGGPD